MYPLPSIKYFPACFQGSDNPAGVALTNKIDQEINTMKNLIIGIQNLAHADYCPEEFLPELADKFGVILRNSDSEALKRRKIFNAVPTHKKNGRWEAQAKEVIDTITGFSASLYYQIEESNSWDLMGHPTDLSSSTRATFGASAAFAGGGMLLGGNPDSGDIPGNILIDLGSDSLSADIVAEVKEQIKDDIVPCYFRIFLGYTNSDGQFVTYTDGIIDENTP